MKNDTLHSTGDLPESTNHKGFKVALVCMPFFSMQAPSIQLGLLHAILEQHGFAVDSHHLNLHLAAAISRDVHEHFCHNRGHLTGEWLFSVAAFPESAEDDRKYFDAFPEECEWAELIGLDADYLSTLRHEVLPQFIDACFDGVDWGQYRVVGFTSTFQQNVASLALAARIKKRYPKMIIVFGGANMEGEMGAAWARAFSFIDFVVVGEGDKVFPALLHSLSSGEESFELKGVVERQNGHVRARGQAAPLEDMDWLPTPNYDDYFHRLLHLGLLQDPKFSWIIPFESSRGCWWGAKKHCTFCGLNGEVMSYRSKTPKRVLAELDELTRRYRSNEFEATDNILDMKYITSLFAEIEKTRMDYSFYYEIKANLSREQVSMLYRGGVRWVQPGIESMSSHVLALMRKGCTMLQNVLLLKWCLYYGISVDWNLLYGFPGETEEDYRNEFKVLKLIPHLEPPKGFNRIRLERFSPYFFDRANFPVFDIRPAASYSYVYPPHVEVDKIAYFFDYRMGDTVEESMHAEAQEWVEEWRRRWESKARARLSYRRTLNSLYIDDCRAPDSSVSHAVHGVKAAVYEFCSESTRTEQQVTEYVQSTLTDSISTPLQARDILEEFCALGVMLSENDKYLSLAIPVNPNW